MAARRTLRALLDRLVPGDQPLSPPQYAVLAAVVVLAVAGVAALPDGAAARVALAAVVAIVLALICARSTVHGIFVTLGWLALLGGARRLVTEFQADPGTDPLLAVAPAGLAVLLISAIRDGAFSRRSVLANGVGVFSVLTVLWAFHPEHASLKVGLGGLLFWLVPMLWFFVGRACVDALLAARIVAFAAVAAVLAAVYGLAQTILGFPSWDRTYIFTRGRFNSLYVGPDTFRPFAAFAAANEYALTMACGVVIFVLVIGLGVVRRDRLVMSFGIGGGLITPVALALSSYRAPTVLVVVALTCVAIVRLRRKALPFVVAAAVVLVVAAAAFSQVDPDSLSTSGPEGMVRRVVVGLGNPFDSEYSTAPTHVRGLESGFRETFVDPLGDGTGSTTTAARRYGESSRGTEWDFADAGVAFGVVGLAAALFVIAAAFWQTGRSAWCRPKFLELVTLGVMIVLFRNWWSGGHYFLVAFLWLLIGSMDRRTAVVPEPDPFELRSG